jgi:CheY-like chemotaxis protein
MLRLYRRMLSSSTRNYRVVQAKNGREAMRILRREKPDVILLDLVMSKMDGLQFLKTRNKEPGLRDIPVIVASVNDPTSQPAVSSIFVVTKRGGLSMQELLASIKQTATLLSTIAPSADPAPPVTLPVGLAFE